MAKINTALQLLYLHNFFFNVSKTLVHTVLNINNSAY